MGLGLVEASVGFEGLEFRRLVWLVWGFGFPFCFATRSTLNPNPSGQGFGFMGSILEFPSGWLQGYIS